ncbi:MAG: b-glycosyltransferase, glycosyltransferase family 2 protein [Chitinophagaceae bacterium]|nr:b-glycosyltransferase, glycosyltransferase family 2 protein [Chitinophagaceae bacterium]
METPLVTVICISYNHADYIYQALASLRDQAYANVEVIIADDSSTDHTKKEILRFLNDHTSLQWKTLFNEVNRGNCKTFNDAFRQAKGKYIIDLAADDYLYASCIDKQVKLFESLPENYGVVFCNVDLVNQTGQWKSTHYPLNEKGKTKLMISQGDVYEEVVKRYFISPVGIMMKHAVLQQLGGYDEALTYEDFDFWVRSSRTYHYAYLDECLVAKRETPLSLSTRFKKKGYERMFESTARVCQKIAWLNQTEKENKALLLRIQYEIRQAIRYKASGAVSIYLQLMEDLKVNRVTRIVYKVLGKLIVLF